jgi:hypothetical protein
MAAARPFTRHWHSARPSGTEAYSLRLAKSLRAVARNACRPYGSGPAPGNLAAAETRHCDPPAGASRAALKGRRDRDSGKRLEP